jgi:hypothetical protein
LTTLFPSTTLFRSFIASSDKNLGAGEIGKKSGTGLSVKGGGRPEFAQFVADTREQARKFLDALDRSVRG